jgi:uncharacterized protein YgbK (DUF1537 family)
MDIVCLADDLSGALEVGGKFAGAGLSALVCTLTGLSRLSRRDSHQVLVIDTETRHLVPDRAYEILRSLAGSMRHQALRCLFKKTDSTLRGNIAAELHALTASFPDSPLYYVAAYPSMGRTVRNGTLFVDGSPVSETAFALDALNPVSESHIPSLLHHRMEVRSIVPAQIERALDPVVYVVDGDTEDDVRRVASALTASRRFLLAAGPAAFPGYLGAFIALERRKRRTRRFATTRRERCLVINGSRHPLARQQVSLAISQGWTVCEPECLTAGAFGSGWVILQLNASPESRESEFGVRVGEAVRDILRRVDVDAMVVIGGDTAFQIVAALGCPFLLAEGEVVPGVPVARIRTREPGSVIRHGRDVFLITKAGGFGRPDVLLQIRECATLH